MSQLASGNYVPNFYANPLPGAVSATAYGVFAPDNASAPYEIYLIETKYTQKNGLYLMPVAQLNPTGDPLPASIIQTSSPYGFKEIWWVAQRRGQQPVLPDPTPGDGNAVLEDQEFIERNDVFDSDGQTPIFYRRGYYRYLLRLPVSIKNGVFVAGNAPVFTQGSQVVSAKNWSASILSKPAN